MSYDLPQFNATEVADIIDATPGSIRDLRDRGLSDYIGTKLENRTVAYSARELAMAAVIRDLTKLGFPVRMAANAAAIFMETNPKSDAVFRGSVDDIALLVPSAGSTGPRNRQLLSAPDVKSAVIELPIGQIWASTIARCEGLLTTRGVLV